jgi:hypothetical protein
MKYHNNTKENKMTKTYEVTYQSPEFNRPVTNPQVSEGLTFHDDGSVTYFYNKFFPACEVFKLVEVPQSYLDAQMAYFDKWGTACE